MFPCQSLAANRRCLWTIINLFILCPGGNSRGAGLGPWSRGMPQIEISRCASATRESRVSPLVEALPAVPVWGVPLQAGVFTVHRGVPECCTRGSGPLSPRSSGRPALQDNRQCPFCPIDEARRLCQDFSWQCLLIVWDMPAFQLRFQWQKQLSPSTAGHSAVVLLKHLIPWPYLHDDF